jgi:ferredoxin-nitrite reductase/sulfite reductase (ferredoxin)
MNWATPADAQTITERVQALAEGVIDHKAFNMFAKSFGIYELADRPDRYMQRIKIPAGIISAQQLGGVADLLDRYTPGLFAHLTTRQDIELHGVARAELDELQRDIARLGLTAHSGGGSTIRNITCCPYSGMMENEPFDVTPYALALAQYYLGRPDFEKLPRKVKIGLECHSEDHALTAIHDIGIVAVQHNPGKKGFCVYVGGGLGGTPTIAQPLEFFTPVDQLLDTCNAILAVFNQHGNRKLRACARLKFLIREWGLEKFQKEALLLRDGSPHETLRLPEWPRSAHGCEEALTVLYPSGNLTSGQLRQVARGAREHGAGQIRITQSHGLLLRDIPCEAVSALQSALQATGGEIRLSAAPRIVHCVGASRCLSSITSSENLATSIQKNIALEPQLALLQDVKIRVSGCPHGCSHHLLADIGLHGLVQRVHGKNVPSYRVFVGGGGTGAARQADAAEYFGKPVALVPAGFAKEAVMRMLRLYGQSRQSETFKTFVSRVGLSELQNSLSDLQRALTSAEVEALCFDCGESEAFQIRPKDPQG